MASRSDGAVSAIRSSNEEQSLSDELQSAVAAGVAGAAPVFNTHSTALARELQAKADGIKSQIADIDAKLVALNDERTDLMLAYSMLSAAAGARETNR